MYIPKLIYELYPVSYIVGGVAAIGFSQTTVAVASGILLVVSGVIILFLRRNYRTTKHIMQQTTS